MMPRGLRTALSATDALMPLYWGVAALAAAGVVALAPEALYKDYHDPVVVAWNWSFAPLDLAFAATGLASVARAQRGGAWRGMAIAFWALRGDFDPGCWLPNLVLLLGPLIWLPRLLR